MSTRKNNWVNPLARKFRVYYFYKFKVSVTERRISSSVKRKVVGSSPTVRARLVCSSVGRALKIFSLIIPLHLFKFKVSVTEGNDTSILGAKVRAVQVPPPRTFKYNFCIVVAKIKYVFSQKLYDGE